MRSIHAASRLANIAPFGAAVLPVQCIISWSFSEAGWRIDSVLVRTDDGVSVHPDWPPGNVPSHWGHLAACLTEDDGGDGVIWDLTGFETDKEESVSLIVSLWGQRSTATIDDSLRRATGILVPGGGDQDLLVIPALLIRDEHEDHHVVVLDTARVDRYRLLIGYRARARWGKFRSALYPGLAGAPSWKVTGGYVLGVTYGNDAVEIDLP